jgi:hypothetical protein
MANRRMISKDILYCDEFLSLPDKEKVLYTYLIINADDDGFLKNYRHIISTIEATQEALENLITSGFVIKFDSGVIVLTHWLCQNQVQPTKKTETLYQDELQLLEVDQTKKYIRQIADNMPTQYNIEKSNIEENRIIKDNKEKNKINKVSEEISDDDFKNYFRNHGFSV